MIVELRVFVLACLSRLVVVLLALGFALLFPAYDSSTRLVSNHSLSALANWDGVHFLDVAQSGTQRFEHSFAFFPGFPLLVRLVSDWLHLDLVMAGVLVANVCFVLAALVLLQIANEKTVWLFLLSPANIFFSSVYSESLFALLVFLGCFFLARKKPLSATAAFFACSAVRSNGAVFALLLLIRKEVVLAGVIGIPFLLHNFRCFVEFCVYMDERDWCSKVCCFVLFCFVLFCFVLFLFFFCFCFCFCFCFFFLFS